ncbi:8610_t:CDS:2 [Entrophospora sp. SA101]|nr:8610_t:CDS:2 [Entrophospora sp. SA101]
MSVLETELQISTDEEGLENKVSNNLNDDKLKKLRIATDSLGGHAVIGELSKPYDILTNTIMELIKKNYNSFDLIAALKKSQQLITDLSFLWNLHKFRTTNIIKRRFERVTKEFDKVLSDLKLEKPFDFVTQKKKDLKAVEHDISIITKFLERAEGSITIPSDELINIYNQFVRKDQYGGAGNVKVRKWLSSGGGSGIEKKKKTKSILVACKRYEQQPQKFFDNLILLPKLNNCPNILKFYALSVVKDWNYHNSTNSSWSPLQISNHVLAGFREVMDFGNDPNIIERSYSKLIRADDINSSPFEALNVYISSEYICINSRPEPFQEEKSNENNDSNEPKKDFDISTVDIKAAAMSWNSFANPNIKDRDDGLGSGQLHPSTLNYYNYYQRSPYQQRYNLYKQPPYSQDYVNWKQNEQDYYYDSCSMLDPVLEQNYPTNPKRVDKHDRGQILLTINVEFEDGHTQAICVHVNDEPADLAKDFCDLWGVTNPVVEPAFEGLIKEEKDKRLGSL